MKGRKMAERGVEGKRLGGGMREDDPCVQLAQEYNTVAARVDEEQSSNNSEVVQGGKEDRPANRRKRDPGRIEKRRRKETGMTSDRSLRLTTGSIA